MVEAGTLCTNANVKEKAGTNANATAIAEAATNVTILMAEGEICATAKYNFVSNYATVSAIGKEFLRNLCSSMAALNAIEWDMSGFTSRTEAQTMLNVNYAIRRDGLNLLRDNTFLEFIKSGVIN